MENKDALAEVEERLKSTKDRRMYERLQTVRLSIMGMPVKESHTGRTPFLMIHLRKIASSDRRTRANSRVHNPGR